MIEYIVEKLLPKELINSNQDKEEILFKVTSYVKNSIDTKILPVTLPSEAIGKVASEKTLIKPIFDKLIYNVQKNSN